MKLDPVLVAFILGAAIMHATWNAMVKTDTDRLCSMAVVMATGTVMCLPALPFVGLPAPAAWPFLVASMIVHVFYYFALLSAYAHGDLSHVYPIARGLGPTLVALVSGLAVGEYLSPREAAGVLLASAGIMALALSGRFRRFGGRATLFALLTGLTIAGYTVADGMGARASENAVGYIVVLNVIEGPWVLVFAWWRRGGPALAAYLRTQGPRAALGGVIATLGYGIAIYALSVGAMAHVAALRETSVLFAALIGTVLLGEKFGPWRVGAAGLIVAGLVLMNLRL